MRLHIIRHADPDYDSDALTALGKCQARALAERIETMPLVRIFASPLGRAQETARYTADATGIKMETLEWMREMSELRTEYESEVLPNPVVIWNLPGHYLRKVCAEGKGLGMSSDLFPQPQTANRFNELKANWVSWLQSEHIQVTDEGWKTDIRLMGSDIAFFCHHGVGLALLSIVLDIPVATVWRSVWLPPASVSTVLFEQYERDRVNPRVICLGDTGHLSGYMRDNNTSGLIYNTR